MLIVGAKGHAVEVWQCLTDKEQQGAVFFDDVTPAAPGGVLGQFPLLRTAAEAQAYLVNTDSRFILGLGGPVQRRRLAAQFREWGGQLTSVIASTAVVSPWATIGPGVNIMHHTLVAPTASLGEGVLLNAGAAVHHDSVVGDYCELAPGARILGRCEVGYGCQVGALAVILSDMLVGPEAIIGAGAVVNRYVKAGTTVVGIPARLI
jgi:sugar O-acyltransferase (sialic acid O-acetyltransferase NeuD family)